MKEDNLKKLEHVRKELLLYSPLSLHDAIDELDAIIESEKELLKRRNLFNNGICPDCGKRLHGKHVMGEGWTFTPCRCMEPTIDEETLEIIKKALVIS